MLLILWSYLWKEGSIQRPPPCFLTPQQPQPPNLESSRLYLIFGALSKYWGLTLLRGSSCPKAFTSPLFQPLLHRRWRLWDVTSPARKNLRTGNLLRAQFLTGPQKNRTQNVGYWTRWAGGVCPWPCGARQHVLHGKSEVSAVCSHYCFVVSLGMSLYLLGKMWKQRASPWSERLTRRCCGTDRHCPKGGLDIRVESISSHMRVWPPSSKGQNHQYRVPCPSFS